MRSILKAVQKMLTNNWVLKVAAFVVAAVIWLAVVNLNDPTKSVTIRNIPITITNEWAITDNNQVYEVKSKKFVNVTVSGRRSIVDNLYTGSFIAEASLDELSLTNSVPVTVSFKNKNIESKVTMSNQSVLQIAVDVENIITKSYSIDMNIIGSLPKNYEQGNIKVFSEKVDITAPESVHDSIDKVQVDVNIDGSTDNILDKYKIELLDHSGAKIHNDENITMSIKKVKVSIPVYKVITVPIVVETTGNPAQGYEVSDISTDPQKVTLVGSASVMNGIKEVKITGDVTDITGITSDVEENVDLKYYLAKGISVRGESVVKLSIRVEGDISRTFTLKEQDIAIRNVPTGYKAEILSNNITIKLTGKEKDFEGVGINSFNAAIDLKGLKEGKSSVELKITVPSGLELNKSVNIKVKLTKKK